MNEQDRKATSTIANAGSKTSLALCAGLLLASCSVPSPTPPRPADPTRALARSLGIINSATADHPRVLKILFYGQSISTPKWTDQAVAKLRLLYPDVRFDYRNMAIGGWSAAVLERAAPRDVAEAYPDLIVFHVYGDHHAYERIIRTFRAETAADIIVQTDHVVQPPEPLCDTGFHLRWTAPPGCRGHMLFKQRNWDDFMSGLELPTLSRKYDLAVEPRRSRWNRYLQSHRIQPGSLLADDIHPNAVGWTLMADLFTSWFRAVAAKAATAGPVAPANVATLAPPRPGTTARYTFVGNRIELLADGPLDGKVRVTVDGKRPEDLDGCWQNSRVSTLPNAPDWPAIKRVGVDPAYHRPDRWSVTITSTDPEQGRFTFALFSQSAGAIDSGTSDQSFTSSDGIVRIEPQDWNLAYARQAMGKGVGPGTAFFWQRRYVCADQAPVPLGRGRVEQRHLVATGLANARHVVTVAVERGAPTISAVRAYRPPLMATATDDPA